MKSSQIAILCSLTMGTTAFAQDWKAAIQITEPPQNLTLRGQVLSYGQGLLGEDYFYPQAFFHGDASDKAECSSADYLTIDYFFGRDGAFEVQSVFDLALDPDGWTAIDPSVFLDIPKSTATILSYEAFEGVIVTLNNIDCVDAENLRISLTVSATFTSDVSGRASPTTVRFQSDSTIPILPFSAF